MTAINLDSRAGDVAACLRGEQQQCAIEIFRFAKPTLRDAFDQLEARVGSEEIAIEISLDVAGAKRIDANAVARPFERQCLRQVYNACL
jgi:hypothetical protein